MKKMMAMISRMGHPTATACGGVPIKDTINNQQLTTGGGRERAVGGMILLVEVQLEVNPAR